MDVDLGNGVKILNATPVELREALPNLFPAAQTRSRRRRVSAPTTPTSAASETELLAILPEISDKANSILRELLKTHPRAQGTYELAAKAKQDSKGLSGVIKGLRNAAKRAKLPLEMIMTQERAAGGETAYSLSDEFARAANRHFERQELS